MAERLRLRDVRTLSTFRLTLWFGLLFAAGVLVLLGTVYFLTARELNARSDRVLKLEAARLSALAPHELPRAMLDEMANSASRLNFYALEDGNGREPIGNMPIPEGLRINHPRDITLQPGDPRAIRVVAVRTRFGQTLYLGRDITPLVDLRHHVLLILIGSGLGIVLLVAVGGVVVSVGPLRRVKALDRVGREIARGDLSARMPIQGSGDELDQFAGTVNVMVEEVGRMLAQVKDVTDVVAHDLRAPLARVRNQLGQARRAQDEGSGMAATLATALTDIDLVLDRFSALLRIAEIEASHRRSGFGPVKVETLLADAVELYQPLAEDRQISLSTDAAPGLTVAGDSELLFEAVSNLIDNAIKFTPKRGRVVVAALPEAEGAVIEVRDSGPGIPIAERESVLRRFHRGSNARGVAGSGIGLSAVMAIVHMHGFALELADAEPGLSARIHCRA